MARTKFLFLHQEASVDNLLVLNCSTVVYVIIHRAYAAALLALILHVRTLCCLGRVV